MGDVTVTSTTTVFYCGLCSHFSKRGDFDRGCVVAVHNRRGTRGNGTTSALKPLSSGLLLHHRSPNVSYPGARCLQLAPEVLYLRWTASHARSQAPWSRAHRRSTMKPSSSTRPGSPAMLKTSFARRSCATDGTCPRSLASGPCFGKVGAKVKA
jgi:hypothetical protein